MMEAISPNDWAGFSEFQLSGEPQGGRHSSRFGSSFVPGFMGRAEVHLRPEITAWALRLPALWAAGPGADADCGATVANIMMMITIVTIHGVNNLFQLHLREQQQSPLRSLGLDRSGSAAALS